MSVKGNIDYEKEAVLKVLLRRWLVHVVYYLVRIYHLQCPVSINGEKMIGTWIFTSGPISLRVNIERKGYCNGKRNHHECCLELLHNTKCEPQAAIVT